MFHNHLPGDSKHQNFQQVFCRVFGQHFYELHTDKKCKRIAKKCGKLLSSDFQKRNCDKIMYHGNDKYHNYKHTGFNQSKRLLYDRWKKPGDVTDIPRWGVTPQMDSRFLEDASFLRLKNLMISYTFPQEWMKKTNFFTNARIYAQGQNLLTFTKFSGLDPEAFTNMYQAQYPMSRQYSFGLELSF